MTKELVKFIQKYKDLLQREQFEDLYDILNRECYAFSSKIPKFTWEMLQLDINPLDYMDKIPMWYAHGLKRLKQITIPNNINKVGVYAFCLSGIETLYFPDSVYIIGDNAANSCLDLKKVILGAGISKINAYAFAYCPKLTDVEYEGTTAQWLNLKSLDMIDPDWCKNDPVKVVKCSNGEVPIR